MTKVELLIRLLIGLAIQIAVMAVPIVGWPYDSVIVLLINLVFVFIYIAQTVRREPYHAEL